MPGETFEEFKDSFSYGSRTDLAFKFLKRLRPDEAAEFFSELLDQLGETVDDGDAGRLVDLAYEWQVRAYAPRPGESRPWTYDDGPFTPPAQPLGDARVALLTSSGHFVGDPRPFGVEHMTQEEAVARIGDFLREAPALSEIPAGTPPEDLRARHGGYDIRGASADPDVAFPLARLRELAADGVIAGVADPAFSFVGAASQKRLLAGVGAWVDRVRATGADVALLVPVWPVCHVSVGHVARALEAAGIPTTSVYVRAFRHVVDEMMLARAVVTRHPMGRPLGPPGDAGRQRRVLEAALALFDAGGRTVVELPEPYRPG